MMTPGDENKPEPSHPTEEPTSDPVPPKKGPGRPPKAKNKPKSVKAPRHKRKQPKDILHPLKSAKKTVADLNLLIKRHNSENPDNQYAEYQPPGKIAAKPAIDVDPVITTTGFIMVALEMLGRKLTTPDGEPIRTRPDPLAIKAAAGSYVNLAALATPEMSPVQLAALTAFGCTVALVFPMIMAAAFGEDTSKLPGGSPPPKNLETERAEDVKTGRKDGDK